MSSFLSQEIKFLPILTANDIDMYS